MNKDFSVEWWRWPLMPLVSVLGAILGSTLIFVVVRISTVINGFDPDSWWPQFVENFFILSSFAYCLSSSAFLVAPKNKLQAAQVMIGGYALLGSAAIIYLWIHDLLPTGYIIQLGVCFALSLTSSIYATINRHQKHQRHLQLQF